MGWAALVLSVPLLAHRYISAQVPQDLPQLPLAALGDGSLPPGEVLVHVPAGTPLPVRVQVEGDVFRHESVVLLLVLNESVDVALRHGEPTGDVRFANGQWRLARETRWISIPKLSARLSRDGPVVDSTLVVNLGGRGGR